MTNNDKHLIRVSVLGIRRANLLDKLRSTDRLLRDAIRGADQAGVERTRLAKAAGVNRQTIYNWLKTWK